MLNIVLLHLYHRLFSPSHAMFVGHTQFQTLPIGLLATSYCKYAILLNKNNNSTNDNDILCASLDDSQPTDQSRIDDTTI